MLFISLLCFLGIKKNEIVALHTKTDGVSIYVLLLLLILSGALCPGHLELVGKWIVAIT
jgi:hypothetical protein